MLTRYHHRLILDAHNPTFFHVRIIRLRKKKAGKEGERLTFELFILILHCIVEIDIRSVGVDVAVAAMRHRQFHGWAAVNKCRRQF